MAENPEPSNPDPVPRTESSAPADYYRDFLASIQKVEEYTKQLTTIIPQASDIQTEKLATAYEKAGQASRSTASSPPGLGSSGGSTLDVTDRAVRAELNSQTRAIQGPRPMDATEAQVEGISQGGPTRASGSLVSLGEAPKQTWRDRLQTDEYNNPVLPRFPGANPNPQDYFNYTSGIFAHFAANRQKDNEQTAATQNAQAAEAAQQQQQQILDKFATTNPGYNTEGGKLTWHGSPATLPADLQKDYNDAGQVRQVTPESSTASAGLGKVSDLLHAGGEGYVQGRYIKGILGNITQPFNNMRTLGYQTGGQAGAPGPLGLRFPWDTAGGFGLEASKMGFAVNSDVSPGQATAIYSGLFNQGWMQGPQANAMRNAGAQIMRQNPYVGEQPQTYAMMDQATRQGATSLDKFVQIMGQVPTAALAAHTSIAQTMSDMDQMGQVSKQTGGTYGAGLQKAQAWQNITGLPAGVMGQLMQSPLVQGQTFLGTGLMPFEQGLASPGQQTQSILNSVNLVGGMVAKQPNLTQQIGSSGFTQTVSGQDQKEALMAKILGVDKATVHTMLTNSKGWSTGAQIYDESNAYAQQVTKDVQTGTKKGSQAAYNVLAGTGKGTYGQLKQDMTTATDAQGHKVFEDWNYYDKYRKTGMSQAAQNKLHAQAQATARHNVYAAGNSDITTYEKGLVKQAEGQRGPTGKLLGSKNPSLIEANHQLQLLKQGKMPTNLSGQVMTQVANDRRKELQRYQSMNTQKFGSSGSNPSGPRVTVELGPAAKKVLHLSSPQAQQKSAAGAGSVDINSNANAPGTYTLPPMPNFDTAGSGSATSTYDYGSQLDQSSG